MGNISTSQNIFQSVYKKTQQIIIYDPKKKLVDQIYQYPSSQIPKTFTLLEINNIIYSICAFDKIITSSSHFIVNAFLQQYDGLCVNKPVAMTYITGSRSFYEKVSNITELDQLFNKIYKIGIINAELLLFETDKFYLMNHLIGMKFISIPSEKIMDTQWKSILKNGLEYSSLKKIAPMQIYGKMFNLLTKSMNIALFTNEKETCKDIKFKDGLNVINNCKIYFINDDCTHTHIYDDKKSFYWKRKVIIPEDVFVDIKQCSIYGLQFNTNKFYLQEREKVLTIKSLINKHDLSYCVNLRFTGYQFNILTKNLKFIKLTNKNEIHNNLPYGDGLNVDVLEFNTVQPCCPGGIYFIDKIDMNKWIRYGNKKMYWRRNVKIPDDAIVFIEYCKKFGYKFKTDKIILLGRQKLDFKLEH
ncbi:MAG: hypothetical protein Edafosvirus2_100 [Edafosvirus sp.]|uniref:Uncharacterized protein n=1 Tax=Edafosvirus sp. TaxID=2487765 RepID=A0A3G4ZV97_9VIRU|nr:MAG: hypothetical protein Edafosvirus2_100 [Edafosvirus sp.]